MSQEQTEFPEEFGPRSLNRKSEVVLNLQELVSLMPCPETQLQWMSYVQQNVNPFVDFLSSIPIPQGKGSISTAEAFWLYHLVRELKPSVIVESGSANGWSSFVLAGGAPEAEIVCFDPYNRPVDLPENARYEDRDWTSIGKWPRDTFCFFDDHCNQRERLKQVQGAVLSNCVFHDVYRVAGRSLLSLQFLDVLGLASFVHTFDPIWDAHSAFCDTSLNPQMYRWLTWVRIEPTSRLGLADVRRAIARHRIRNPMASPEAARNWIQA